MTVDFIIAGQGLCGTWLSYFLMREGASVLVFDAYSVSSASNAASGIINPITGKRLARQWMADKVLPFAEEAYEAIGNTIGTSLFKKLPIHTFFSNAEEAGFFEQKATTTHEDLLSCNSTDASACFNYHYGIGSIYPAMLVEVNALTHGWRNRLQQQGDIRKEAFDWTECAFENDGLRYKDVQAKAVIDCSGQSAAHNPLFSRLPFALNKGEALIASIPGLPANAIYKYATLSIVPWEGECFWIGSTFDWDFTDEMPTAAFRQKAGQMLKQWLRLPFEIHEHFAAIRPATVTRDAFAGLHPVRPQVGILNGMGSKGVSLAPFLAHNLAQHLAHGAALIPQVDISRYSRALSR